MRHTLIVAGAAMVAAGTVRVAQALLAAPDLEPFNEILTGAGSLGIGVAALGLELGWFDPPAAGTEMSRRRFYALGAALTAFVGAFILRCGMHQIGGYDHSITVDFGWRLCQGQRPYADFPCTVPPGFALGGKFAFEWFGASWRSIIDMTALFSMATFAWSLFLLEHIYGRGLATLLWALGAQAFSMMVASFWWYSPITATSAVIYMLAAMDWLRRPNDRIAIVSYGAALLLMATMKANEAGVMIPGFSAVLFISPRHRWRALAVSLAAFGGFLLLLALNGFSFFGLIDAYRYISPRGVSLVPFLIDLSPNESRLAMLAVSSFALPAIIALSRAGQGRRIWGWIPGAVMVVLLAWFAWDTRLKAVGAACLLLPPLLALAPGRQALRAPGVWIGIVALLGGIYGFLTNSELKLVDLPPVFIAAMLLTAEMRAAPPAETLVYRMPFAWHRYFCVVCVVLGCVGLEQGYSRARIRSIGQGRFFQFDDTRHTIDSGFFKGLHCGDYSYEVLKDIGELLRRDPSATVWFGNRMEWAYAAFGKPSPTGEPVIWDPLTMFEGSKRAVYFAHLMRSRPQMIVLFKSEFGDFTLSEREQLLSGYRIDASYRYLTVLRIEP